MPEERDTSQKKSRKGRRVRSEGRGRLTPARRRLLLISGIVLLAVTVFVIAPGYLALQPQFMERYPNMEPEFVAWETSVHSKGSCQACHIPPGILSQAGYSTRMLGEFYVSQVFRNREPDLLDTPVNEACESCHFDLRAVSPSGDLNIPHRAHVDVLEMECVECHEYLVHEESPEGNHTPRMVKCLKCHDGEQAKNACTTCHTEKAAPEGHQDPEWVIIHPQKQREIDCAECHGWTEDWCVECHTRRPGSHGEKWRSTHRLSVEERRNCEACHEADFCITCHGEVPSLNFDPALDLVE